jgi:hypothetical protein
MIPPTQQELLRRLAAVCELSPGVRFGQIVSHLGFLAEDMGERSLAEIEDEDLLRVIDHHRSELARRQSNVA